MATTPPARLAKSLTDCALSLCDLATMISSGALTLSEEDARLVNLMAMCLSRMADGEPVTAYWGALLREIETGPLDGRGWWMEVALARGEAGLQRP